mgnify:CR=1 FL=1
MRTLPPDYSALELKPDEKLLINRLEMQLDDNWLGLIKIVPLPDVQPIVLALIHPRAGVYFLSIDPFSEVSRLNAYLVALTPFWKNNRVKMQNKLLSHVNLRQSNGKLRFPFAWSVWFPNISSKAAGKEAHLILDGIFFENEIEEMVDFEEASGDIIDASMETSLFQVIVPEYMIPVYTRGIVGEEEIAATSEIDTDLDYSIAKDDEPGIGFRLTDEQIDLVNDIHRGSQLILACAGSGKSAILISKAFKIASLHPEKQILITCYNANLRNYYEWRIGVAGFRERNVECLTFHALCRRLLLEAGINPPIGDGSTEAFDKLFQIAEQALHSGKIRRRYFGIFIDEIQIFRPEWYRFCVNLLESQKERQHILVVAGDKSQNINDNVVKGLAPWQAAGNDMPKFEGKTMRIDMNFRNSRPINEYVDRFVDGGRECFQKLELDIDQDPDLFLRGRAFRPGSKPNVVFSDRYQEADDVVSIIKILNQGLDVPLGQIAVLMHHKQYKPAKYYILYWLKEKLEDNDIPYSVLSRDRNHMAVRYGDRSGVALMTIESALGLDFQAVILCGLYSMGQFEKSDSMIRLMERVDEQALWARREDFIKNFNALYTAMTRARDHLSIVLTRDPRKNIYSRLLADAPKRR